ncbi:N-(5'-phosphoribosyl)anthranilate isomerase [Chloroflexota bacterium]
MVKVKICGITNLEDALVAVEYGADALGFIFAPSPRQVDAEVVREIVAQLPPFVRTVGVFVDSELETIRDIMSTCSLDLAQLHGEETPQYCAALFPHVIKSFTTMSLPSTAEIGHYRAVAYLLDKDKGLVTEEETEHLWELAREIGDHGPVILAGGLTPGNVVRAIEVACPYAVDVSSGVEMKPGRKDYAKIKAFIKATKNRTWR